MADELQGGGREQEGERRQQSPDYGGIPSERMWALLLTDSTRACRCRGSLQPARVSAPPQPGPPLCPRLFLLTNKAGRTGSISRTNTRRPVFCPCEEMLLPRHQAPRAPQVRQQTECLVANSCGRSQHPHYRKPLQFPARSVFSGSRSL